jgi:hypothetical protein
MATDVEVITTVGAVVDSGIGNSFTFRDLFEVCIPFKVTLTETSVAAAKSAQADATVTGAALGDFVLFAPSLDATTTVATAHVTAANTITVCFANQDSTDPSTPFAAASVFYGLLLRPGSRWAELA